MANIDVTKRPINAEEICANQRIALL